MVCLDLYRFLSKLHAKLRKEEHIAKEMRIFLSHFEQKSLYER